MCGDCKQGSCKGGCVGSIIAKVLVIIGGVNWGLVGVGMLLGQSANSFNVVNLLLGSVPTIEAIVYVLVGVAAIMTIFGCKCGKCKDSCCAVEEKKEEAKM
jgi:hypothetical protein